MKKAAPAKSACGELDRDGYVSGAFYPFQHHPDLDPMRHGAALLLAGQGSWRAGDQRSYLELGCGSGFTLAALAAAHPQSYFLGVDLDAAHIEAAKSLVFDARLKNIDFICADFADAAIHSSGPFDTISAHGVWSWVSPRARRAIIDLLIGSLNEGGVFYLSYNCLPGMAALEPIRKLLMIGADQSHSELLKARIGAARDFLASFEDVGSLYALHDEVRQRIADVVVSPEPYLAHEYFNEHWRSFYHSDVEADLREAQLTYCCSTRIPDDMLEVRFDVHQIDLLKRTGSSGDREVLKDFLTNRTFRTDLFIRGNVGEHVGNVDSLAGTYFVCVKDESEIPQGAPHTYQRVIDALMEPRSHAQLVAAMPGTATRQDAMEETVRDLLAMEVIAPAFAPEGNDARLRSTRTFNRVVLDRSRKGEFLPGLVSPVTGGIVPLEPSQLSALRPAPATKKNAPSGVGALSSSKVSFYRRLALIG